MSPSSTTDNTTDRLADDFAANGMNENAARILAAALVLFSEKGYAATTVREIVQDADVTNPMLYYYFESKEGVFRALLEFLFDYMGEKVREILQSETPLKTKMRQVIAVHLVEARTDPQILRFIYSVLFGPRKSRPPVDVVALYGTIHGQVEATFRQAIDAGELAPRQNVGPEFLTERFLGLISNHLMGALTVYDHVEDKAEREFMLDELLSDEALDQILDFFFHGAGQVAREVS